MTDELPGRGPHVEAAERAVLGTISTSRTAAEAVTAMLTGPDCFSTSAHQAVYDAVRYLADENEPIDQATILRYLVTHEEGLWRTGQAGVILATLAEHATPSYLSHAQTVMQAARTRRTHAAWMRAGQMIASPAFDPDAGVDEIFRLIGDAAAGPDPNPIRSQAEIFADVVDKLERGVDPGLPTGFADLDQLLGGLRPGTLTVLGARPAVGKSLVASTVADHLAARLGHTVLYASLEMTANELMQRRMAATATVELERLVKGQMRERDWERVNRYHDQLANAPLVVDDKDGQSQAYIRSRLRSLERAGNPAKLLIIDDLRMMAEPQTENRQLAVAKLAQGGKHLAKEFGIPVVLLAQVKRAAENRADKVPGMADLRESGEIEAVADVVLLLHREDYYEQESPRAGEMDVHVAKNRQGPQSIVTVLFQGHYGRAVDMAPDHIQEGRPWSPTAQAEEAA
jgi:replicative DNA helicase